MSTIINSAWKGKKAGTIVVFKGEEYEIGSTAYASLEAAVTDGVTSDLVIVDKKLTSPVKKNNITGAATDIFKSTYKEADSSDNKTHTETVKFAAAAGGTASFKDDDATLVGFEKVTANAAGGSFTGGKRDIASSLKEVSDSDKSIETADKSASVASSATGSLSVTGKNSPASVSVAAIADAEGNLDKVDAIIKEAYKEATGKDYEDKTGATYANVTLKLAEISGGLNGGSYTEKATVKTSDTNSEKISKAYTYSAVEKTGSGTATLTDASAEDISGYKTVKITTSTVTAPVTIDGDIISGNRTYDDAVKTAYAADQSFTYSGSSKETEAVVGTLAITGKVGKEVKIDDDIEGFASANLKYAEVGDEFRSSAGSEKKTLDIVVKKQKDVDALTVTGVKEHTSVADGSLTAANSVLRNIKDVKTVTISNSSINGDVTADNVKSKETKKETGVAVEGITDKADGYVSKFDRTTPLVDNTLVYDDQAYTVDYAKRSEISAGGVSFKFSGKASAASVLTKLDGYKTVSLDNTDATNTLTVTMTNTSSVTDTQRKISFVPERSYSDSSKTTTTQKAFGDATIKGRTSASVAGFASVKATGSASDRTITSLTSVTGQRTASTTTSESATIKAGKENHVGSYTKSETFSKKAATTLNATNATVNGTFSGLKTVKLSNVAGASGAFTGALDEDSKTSKKIEWKAEEISAAEVMPALITNEKVTSWTESTDTKKSATGTFTLTNTSTITDNVSVSANGFKSVTVSGSQAHTTLTGVAGQTTDTTKATKSLAVKGAKGTYSDSSTTSNKAATALTVTNAMVNGTFTGLKSATLKDVAIGSATVGFTAALDNDRKTSNKLEWNANDATFADVDKNKFHDSVTSWTKTSENKNSVVGSFSLKNAKFYDATPGNPDDDDWTLGSITDFKTVEISGAGSANVNVKATLSNQGDSSVKTSLKRTVSATKRTQDLSDSSTATTVGSLTVTGTAAAPIKLDATGSTMNYASITLKDATITGANASAYAVSKSYTVKETATLDSGTATVVDLKVTRTYTKKGNGSFTVTGSGTTPTTAFTGDLNGYGTITLKGNKVVSFGNVNNYKYDGDATAVYQVPGNGGEYFDVLVVNDKTYTDPIPAGAVALYGNISGSYKLDKNGQIESKWTASTAKTSTGSFSLTADYAAVTVGTISGYDKVTLNGIKTVAAITGTNDESIRTLNYKYAKDEEVANSDVTITSKTSASSVKVSGKTFSGTLQSATVTSIADFKSVTLEDAIVSGTIEAHDETVVTTKDAVNMPNDTMTATTKDAVGTLTVSTSKNATTVSELKGNVTGFEKVVLENTKAVGINFIGGDSYTVMHTDTTKYPVNTAINAADGSFSAVSDRKQTVDPKLSEVQTVNNVTGFAKVELKNYNAGKVDANVASTEFTAADDDKETPKTWKYSAATRNNNFTASADNYVDDKNKIVQNAITVGDVIGYGKVEATGLTSIGKIENASITDTLPGAFDNRIYGATHYGDYTATAKEAANKYTAMSVTAGSSAKVKGVVAKDSSGNTTDTKPTTVTGNVAGYSTVTLDTVELGNSKAPALVVFAGGKYTYATRGSDEVVTTSTSTADGKLEIKNATFVAGTTFSAEGFKTVDVNIAGIAQFTNIIGGTETAQFTGATLDYTTFKCGENLKLTTGEGSVTGKVAGYATVNFTDTNFSGTLYGYDLGTKKVAGETVKTNTARAEVTFDDADKGDTAQTIAGTITNAKSIVFKSSTADASVDFNVTAVITSQASSTAAEIVSGDLTIEIDKCQTTIDLSKFDLDLGDVIDLTSGTGAGATASITLGGDTSDLAAYFAKMSGAKFTGTGDIHCGSLAVADVKAALDTAKIGYDPTITFKA